MKALERVLRTLNFQEVDRVPFDFSAEGAFLEKLYQYFNIKEKKIISSPLISCVDHQIMSALGCDLRMVAPRYIGPPIEYLEDGSFLNLFGVLRKLQRHQGGQYYAYCGTPLKGKSIDEVLSYPWPDPNWFDYDSVVEQCLKVKDYAIVCGFPGNVDFLNKAGTLYGVEDTLIGIARQDPVLLAIFDKLSDFFYEYNKRIFEKAQGLIPTCDGCA